jgi:hypothetical protein
MNNMHRLTLVVGLLVALPVCAQQQAPRLSRTMIPLIVWDTPSLQCAGTGGTTLNVSSHNGQPSYQPQPNQCIKLTDTTGQLVPGSPPAGFAYTTPQFVSPPLSLVPGANYTLEIVMCSTGVHAYPPAASMPNPFPYANASLAAPNCRKGMSWGNHGPSDPVSGVLRVGCQPGASAGGDCNPYVGDTACSVQLPLLCRKALSLPRPASYAGSRWSGNVIATTPPVSPAAAGLNTRAAANAYCAAQFGNDPSWKVAAFHDGGGWNFAAYGNTGTQSPRFWVDIANQPNGNCWGP